MNIDLFNEKYYDFKEFITEQDGNFFSFDMQPYIKKHESYKDKVNAAANERLNVSNWRDSDIGKGKILKSIRHAIDVEDNNLLIHDNRRGLKARPDKSLHADYNNSDLKAYERALFDLYKSNISDKEAFNRILKYSGRRYPFVAYLFFLKSKKKYLPIAPTTFDDVFKSLDSAVRTTRKCSWENYTAYINEIRKAQHLLQTKSELTDEYISLLDAHSFLWILGSQMKNWTPRNKKATASNPVFKMITPQKREINTKAAYNNFGKPVDFIKDQFRKINLGKYAEEIVMRYEKEVSPVVIDVSTTPSLGYDIEVRDETGLILKRIEVKTEGADRSFLITINEVQKSMLYDNYYIYIVRHLESKPEIQGLKIADLLNELTCTPVSYRVYF